MRTKEEKEDLQRAVNLFKKILQALKPPPKLTIDTWADKYRILSTKTSAEAGKWKTDRVPFQREVMRAISDKKTEKIVMMYGAQLSKTEILINSFGYYADYDPSPIMFLMPTQKMAEDFATTRLNDMIHSTPQLKNKIINNDNSRDTKTQKEFAGGYIVLTGSNSATELSSRPIRVLLADEIDRFPQDVKNEGDPLNLAIERTKTFWNKKIVLTSTPTIKNESRIEQEYEHSTQEEYFLPCPKCGAFQKLEWKNIIFDEVGHKCPHCLEISKEHDWKKQMKKGEWRSNNKEVDPYKVRGFHINELYSPFSSWASIIEKFKKSKNDPQLLKVFVNTTLGETWEERTEEINVEEFTERRELYTAEVPDGVKVLTAGVDVQDDRLEVEVVGWGEEEESWGIIYKVLIGNPAEKLVWEQLDRFLETEFSYKDGEKIRVLCTCIDTGGHYTQEVYDYVKPREFKRIYGIKGVGGDGKAYIGKATRNNKKRILLIPVGVNTGKETILGYTKIKEVGARFMHFPLNKGLGYDEAYFKGLLSEKKIKVREGTQKKTKWVNIYKRNEPLDVRNYSLVALRLCNLDLTKTYNVNYLNSLENRTHRKRGTISKGF